MRTVNEKRERTLLWSCLLSAWAPLVTGYAAYIGQSVILFADFFRRTSELFGLIFSWVAARTLNKHPEWTENNVRKLEMKASLIIAVIMLISGIIVGIGTVSRFMRPMPTERIGLGFAIVLMGLVVNGIFHFRYKRLHRMQPGPILQGQASLYGVKTLTDATIATALLLTRITPEPFALYLDPIGSLGIALLLLYTGWNILRSVHKKQPILR